MHPGPPPPPPPPGLDPRYPHAAFPAGPPPGQQGVRPLRSGMAVAAMIAGIVGIVTFFAAVASVLAVVFGLVGAHQVKRDRDRLHGIGLARAGWVTGLVGLAFTALFWAWAATDGAFDEVPGRQMQVGTCIDLDAPLDDGGDVAPTVSCSLAHDAEVFEIGWLDPRRDAGYPGAVQARDAAIAACSAEPFQTYVGAPSGVSGLRVEVLVPSAADWTDWRGEYVCLARPAEGRLDRSVHLTGL